MVIALDSGTRLNSPGLLSFLSITSIEVPLIYP